MKGEHRISHPNADIIRNLADSRLKFAEGVDSSHVLLSEDEINAILWAACLIDDINAKFAIVPR